MEYSGVQWSTSECRGVPQSAEEYSGVEQSTTECSVVQLRTTECIVVRRICLYTVYSGVHVNRRLKVLNDKAECFKLSFRIESA